MVQIEIEEQARLAINRKKEAERVLLANNQTLAKSEEMYLSRQRQETLGFIKNKHAGFREGCVCQVCIRDSHN